MAAAAFPDPKWEPGLSDLAKRVGPGYDTVEKAVAAIRKEIKRISTTWMLSKTSGWYVTYDKADRRLFYLFPKQGDFLLRIVFNDKGIEALKKAALSELRTKLSKAKKYAEGTLLEFTSTDLSTALLIHLLRIKIGSVS